MPADEITPWHISKKNPSFILAAKATVSGTRIKLRIDGVSPTPTVSFLHCASASSCYSSVYEKRGCGGL